MEDNVWLDKPQLTKIYNTLEKKQQTLDGVDVKFTSSPETICFS